MVVYLMFKKTWTIIKLEEKGYTLTTRNPTEKFSEGGASKTNKRHLHKN